MDYYRVYDPCVCLSEWSNLKFYFLEMYSSLRVCFLHRFFNSQHHYYYSSSSVLQLASKTKLFQVFTTAKNEVENKILLKINHFIYIIILALNNCFFLYSHSHNFVENFYFPRCYNCSSNFYSPC